MGECHRKVLESFADLRNETCSENEDKESCITKLLNSADSAKSARASLVPACSTSESGALSLGDNPCNDALQPAFDELHHTVDIIRAATKVCRLRFHNVSACLSDIYLAEKSLAQVATDLEQALPVCGLGNHQCAIDISTAIEDITGAESDVALAAKDCANNPVKCEDDIINALKEATAGLSVGFFWTIENADFNFPDSFLFFTTHCR
eukprot:gene24745-30134_t